ncbi:MAG: invasion associated locus B family protein [Hyphomicrobium sp.]|nr:invasion associated locus B family protein [Hyphomicrobium sp.]
MVLQALPALAEGGATVTGTYGSWSLYKSESKSHKICFVAAAPEDKKPAKANRAAVLFYISAWPKDGIRSEVSVKLGYPIKAKSDVKVSIGDANFTLFVKDERAFVADTTDELKLIEQMKKGSTMQVDGVSERGTETSDTYSLSGISQALQSMAESCSASSS